MAFLAFKSGRAYAVYTDRGKKRWVSLSKFADKRVTSPRIARTIFQEWVKYGQPEARARGIEIAGFFERYRKHTAPPQKSLSTYQADCRRLEVIEKWLLGKRIRYITDITPMIVDEFREWKSRVVNPKGFVCKPRTVNRHLQLLRVVINLAIRWDLHPGPNPLSNQLGRVMLPERGKREPRILTDAEVEIIESRMPADPPLLQFCRLGYDAGLRRGEIVHLWWKNVDLDQGTLTIKAVPGFDPKSLRARSIPLTARLHRTLSDLPQKGRYVLDKGLANQGRNLPLYHPIVWYRKIVGHWFAELGIGDGANLHSLRHTYATRLIRQGVPLTTICQLTGHSSIKALEPYLHAVPEDARGAVKLLDIQAAR